MVWTLPLRDVTLDDVSQVGGKNASLGELLRELSPLGVQVPDGFAITADAYRHFIHEAGLDAAIDDELRGLRRATWTTSSVVRIDFATASRMRPCLSISRAEIEAELPRALARVRRRDDRRRRALVGDRRGSSGGELRRPAGELPQRARASRPSSMPYEARSRASSRRAPSATAQDMGFDHTTIALSVGVQKMVRSDRASAGVIFTLDPETGHRGVVLVTSSFGLGESVVQGRVAPDQFVVHKATLREGFAPLVRKKLGTKEVAPRLRRDGPQAGARASPFPWTSAARWSLSDERRARRSRGGRCTSRTTTRESTAPTLRWTSSGRRTA